MDALRRRRRFAEPMRRGYDIVTHDAFQGRHSGS